MGVRWFLIFLSCIAAFPATSAFAYETQVTVNGDLFKASMRSRPGEEGDAQRLYDALLSPGRVDDGGARQWRGRSINVSCQKDIYRCRGCQFYDCAATVMSTEDSFVDGNSIETFLAGPDAQSLFETLALPGREIEREGVKIIQKTFSTTDRRFSLVCGEAVRQGAGTTHRCKVYLNGN